MRGAAQPGQHGEEVLEDACLAQPVEPLPDAVPLAEPLGQRPPGQIVHGEILQRFEKQPIVARLRAPRREAGPEHLQGNLTVSLAHLRGHADPSKSVGNP